jgi:HSP20 family protein
MVRQALHPFSQLHRQMDRLLSGLPWDGSAPLWPVALQGQPAVNFWESGDAFLFEMELPGVKKQEIDISIAEGELTVRVERPEVQGESVTFHRCERPVGPLTRVVRLPGDVDIDKVQAELRQGVLTLRLPKAESARPRKIQVISGE